MRCLRADERQFVQRTNLSRLSVIELRTPPDVAQGAWALALSGPSGRDGRTGVRFSAWNRNSVTVVRLSRLVDTFYCPPGKSTGDALPLISSVDLGALLKEQLEENQMFAAEQRIKKLRPAQG